MCIVKLVHSSQTSRFRTMGIKLNLIAAACENMGIGKNNDLPWRLKSEMKYFTRMTTETKDPSKKNVILMGRKTWDAVPGKFKPFKDRINIVLSRNGIDLEPYKNVLSFRSLEEAIDHLQDQQFQTKFENVWVIGGSQIYKKAMESKCFHRLYLTEIKKDFDCDTFFPALADNLEEVIDPKVPVGVQQENGIEYVIKVYQNATFSS